MGFQLGSLFSQQTPFCAFKSQVWCSASSHTDTDTHKHMCLCDTHTHGRAGPPLPPSDVQQLVLYLQHSRLSHRRRRQMDVFLPLCRVWVRQTLYFPQAPKTQQRTQFWEMKTDLPKTRLWNMFPFLDLFIYLLFSCVIFPSVTQWQKGSATCVPTICFASRSHDSCKLQQHVGAKKKKKKTKNSSSAGWGGVKPRPVSPLLHCFYKNTVNSFWRFGSNRNACRRLLTTFAENEKFFEADLEF